MTTTVDPDITSVGLSVLAPLTSQGLELLGDLVMNPRWPDATVKAALADRQALIRASVLDPSQRQRATLAHLVYGDRNALGSAPGSQLIAALAALAAPDVQRHFESEFRPEAATLVIAGDVDEALAMRAAEHAFGHWKSTRPAAPTAAKADTATASRGVFVIDVPGRLQSVIVAGQRAPARSPQSLLDQRIVESLVQRRLSATLRDVKHWSYGASTTLVGSAQGSLFWSKSEVQSDRTVDALAEIEREIAAIRDGVAPIPDVAVLRSSMVNEVARPLTMVNGLASAATDIVRMNVAWPFLDSLMAQASALDNARVLASGKWLTPDQMTVVIVGDAKLIAAQFEKAGRPRPIVLPPE